MNESEILFINLGTDYKSWTKQHQFKTLHGLKTMLKPKLTTGNY